VYVCTVCWIRAVFRVGSALRGCSRSAPRPLSGEGVRGFGLSANSQCPHPCPSPIEWERGAFGTDSKRFLQDRTTDWEVHPTAPVLKRLLKGCRWQEGRNGKGKTGTCATPPPFRAPGLVRGSQSLMASRSCRCERDPCRNLCNTMARCVAHGSIRRREILRKTGVAQGSPTRS
jgi:hypothetical protein